MDLCKNLLGKTHSKPPDKTGKFSSSLCKSYISVSAVRFSFSSLKKRWNVSTWVRGYFPPYILFSHCRNVACLCLLYHNFNGKCLYLPHSLFSSVKTFTSKNGYATHTAQTIPPSYPCDKYELIFWRNIQTDFNEKASPTTTILTPTYRWSTVYIPIIWSY